MPAPPKLFLTLLYKLEGPNADEVTVALELTTWDSSTCHEGNVTSLPGEDPAPHPPRHALHCQHPQWGTGPAQPLAPPTLLPLSEPNGRHHPRFLPAPPPGLAKLLAACDRGSHGWTSR